MCCASSDIANRDEGPAKTPDPETVTEFRGKVGSFFFFSSREDIGYPLGMLAKHISNPGPAHTKALHQLLRYLKVMQDCCDSTAAVIFKSCATPKGYAFQCGVSSGPRVSPNQETPLRAILVESGN